MQQKREEHKNEEQDAIQRAIDEMYAKQAERYVGDSSLNDDSDLIDNSTDASQLHTNGVGLKLYQMMKINKHKYKMKTLMTLM